VDDLQYQELFQKRDAYLKGGMIIAELTIASYEQVFEMMKRS